jgi:hypothetical protein
MISIHVRLRIEFQSGWSFDKKKNNVAQNTKLKVNTATGLENWAIGSTLVDLYSSPLNSEKRYRKDA